MKRIMSRVFGLFWRLALPVRVPIMQRFDARVSRLISDTANARMMPTLIEALASSGARLERIERSLSGANRTAENLAEEVDVVLNGLSREIFRLQSQLESLQRRLDEESAFAANVLPIASESGSEPANVRSSPEMAKVG